MRFVLDVSVQERNFSVPSAASQIVVKPRYNYVGWFIISGCWMAVNPSNLIIQRRFRRICDENPNQAWLYKYGFTDFEFEIAQLFPGEFGFQNVFAFAPLEPKFDVGPHCLNLKEDCAERVLPVSLTRDFHFMRAGIAHCR